MKAEKGFTLVEILIVVVILGILAAIVIPQFTSASTEARESALVSDIQAMRSQIELYKIQHLNDQLPGANAATTFVEAMTRPTDTDGLEVAVGTAGAKGPYMKSVPINPFSQADPATNLVREEAGASTAGADTHHWVFNTDTGDFQADDTELNPTDNTPHWQY